MAQRAAGCSFEKSKTRKRKKGRMLNSVAQIELQNSLLLCLIIIVWISANTLNHAGRKIYKSEMAHLEFGKNTHFAPSNCSYDGVMSQRHRRTKSV